MQSPLSLLMRVWSRIQSFVQSSTTFVAVCVSALLFGVAYWVRMPTVTFALPYIPHVDESYVMDLAYKGLREHIWFATSFWRPHLNLYTAMLAIVVDSNIHGFDWSILPVNTDRITAPITPFIAVRTFYIALGAVTVVIVYHWAATMFPRWVAVLAGVTTAFMTYHITFSGLVTPDVLTCLGCTTFLYVTTKYERYPQRRYLDWMAFIAGVTTSAKYNFIALFVVLCFVVWRDTHLYRSWQIIIRSGFITACGFFLFTPSILIHFSTFVYDFISELGAYHETTTVVNGYSGRFPFGLYWDFFAYTIFSPSILIAFIFGISTLRRQQLSLQAALLLLCIEFVFFFSASYHWPRNFIFFIPAAVVISFAGIYNTFHRLKHAIPTYTRWLTGAETGIYLLVLVPVVLSGYQSHQYFSQTYTLNIVDEIVAQTRPPAIMVGDIEATLNAERPWVITDRLYTNDDIALWQSGGISRFVINTKLFPKPQPQFVLTRQHIKGDRDGGSGFPYNIFTTDARRALRAIGRPMRNAIGVNILGVRIGRGALRAQMTPLSNSPHVAHSTAPLLVNVYLQVESPPTHPDALLFVQLFDANQQKITQRNTPPVDYYPMSQWRKGDFVIAMGDMPVDVLPAGQYRLVIGFYDVALDKRLPVIGSSDGTYTVAFTVDQ